MRPSSNRRNAARSSQAVKLPGVAGSGSNPFSTNLLRRVFAGLFGAFLGLSLLKFGNPPIMEKWVSTPADAYEVLLGYPWPIKWAWWLLSLVAVVGILSADWRRDAPRWLLALPLIWFGWQCVAGTQAVDSEL